jgi:hypothetical protein
MEKTRERRKIEPFETFDSAGSITSSSAETWRFDPFFGIGRS